MSPQNITLKLEGLELSYNYYYGRLETRIEDYKRWPWSPFKVLINDLEKELMNSLYKKRLLEHFISSIPQITAKNLQNIIQEEEKEIGKYDIEDLIKELKISYHASCFCTKTDKPESYRITTTHSFKETKYENNKFDLYLKQVLKLGSRIIKENDGWIDAKEQSKEVIDSETRYIPYLKKGMQNSYSKSEHLDFRVRDRMSQFIYPLFTMLRISGSVLHLEKDPLVDSIEGFTFWFSIDNKESILSDIRRKNSELKMRTHDIIKDKIYRSFDQKKMLNEWLIPFPVLKSKDLTDYLL